LHLENEVAVVKTPTVISNNPILHAIKCLMYREIFKIIVA